MRATIDLPDDLYRGVSEKSTREGRPMSEIAVALFRAWVDDPKSMQTAYELLEDGCGIVESGVGDLATNPKHLEGLGRE